MELRLNFSFLQFEAENILKMFLNLHGIKTSSTTLLILQTLYHLMTLMSLMVWKLFGTVINNNCWLLLQTEMCVMQWENHCYCYRKHALKVVGNRFQYFLRLTVWWVIITALYQLMPKSWHQQTAQSSGNKLLFIFWQNRLP